MLMLFIFIRFDTAEISSTINIAKKSTEEKCNESYEADALSENEKSNYTELEN